MITLPIPTGSLLLPFCLALSLSACAAESSSTDLPARSERPPDFKGTCDRALRDRRIVTPPPGEVDSSRAERAASACGALAPAADNALFRFDFPMGEEGPIEQFRTWSGPNQHCEFPPSRPTPNETATQYYVRAILPHQAKRQRIIGYPSYGEVDVDCITRVFSPMKLAELSKTDDPIAKYVVGIGLVRSGCEAAREAIPTLLEAARSQSGAWTSKMYHHKPRRSLVPEALYAAAAVRQICSKDIDEASRLLAEAESSGYRWAGRPTY